MRGAFAKIGRCCRFQPPASSPQPSESNREALRLEIRLTRRKQTIHHRSNREKDGCFSAADVRPRWDSRAGTTMAGVARYGERRFRRAGECRSLTQNAGSG
jgi:hypothetical protein